MGMNNNSLSSSTYIYMRGIQSQEMESILQFIYLGQATIYKDRMREFLRVAKGLELKELSQNHAKEKLHDVEETYGIPTSETKPEPHRIENKNIQEKRNIIESENQGANESSKYTEDLVNTQVDNRQKSEITNEFLTSAM